MAILTPAVAWPGQSSDLRELLHINATIGETLRCHSLTQQEIGCRNRICKANIKIIDGLLDTIATQRSLSAAITFLNQLVRAVLCAVHREKDAAALLKRWRGTLEPGEVSITNIPPISLQFPDVLKRSVAFAKLISATSSTRVVKVEDEEESLAKTDVLNIIPSYINTRSPAWSKTTSAIKPCLPKKDDIAPDANPISTALALVNKSSITSTHTQSRSPSPSVKEPKSQPYGSLEPKVAGGSFARYGAHKSVTEINEAVQKLLRRPLTTKERLKEGHVYGYVFPETYHDPKPLIKIGYTSDPIRRMKDWARQCGYTPKMLIIHGTDFYVKVEKLVHVQLYNNRLRDNKCCPGCHKKHDEWFRVRSRRAAITVELWSHFMRMEPYDEHGILKEKWKARLDEVDLSRSDCWKRFVDLADADSSDSDGHSSSDTSFDFDDDSSDYDDDD